MGYRQDVRHLFTELNVLTIPSKYILECLTYIKRNIGRYSCCSEHHDHDTRNKLNVDVKFLRIGKSRSCYNYYAPTFFNKLPIGIRELNEINFVREVKRLLCSHAFYSIDEFLGADL